MIPDILITLFFGIIILWILGKAIGFSFKMSIKRNVKHRKFWLILLAFLLLLFLKLHGVI